MRPIWYLVAFSEINKRKQTSQIQKNEPSGVAKRDS